MEQTPSTLDPVQGFAEIVLLTLRANGVSDSDILKHYTTPNPRADARMEAKQLQDDGTIWAPALAVKEAMKTILLAANATLPGAVDLPLSQETPGQKDTYVS